jgi:formate hydrogenlyase transcriptional activator
VPDFTSPGSSVPIPIARPDPLRDPEKLFAAYFNSPAVGVCILDSNLRYLAINRKLAEIHGMPADQNLGKTVREVLGSIASVVEAELQRVLSTGEPRLNFEACGILAARTDRAHWISHFSPIRDADGIVTRIGVVVVETTEREKLETSNRQLAEQLGREIDRLQILQDVGSILASNWNMHEVFPAISARIRRMLHQEYASLSLRDAVTGLMVRQAYDFPLGKGVLGNLPVQSEDAPAACALQQRSPVIYSRDQLQGFDADVAKGFLAEGIQSLCYVPLLRPKEPLGVFVLGSTRRSAFRDDDLTLLNQVAAQLAAAIENYRSAAEVDALRHRLSGDRKHLQGDIRPEGSFIEIVGESPALKQVLEQVSVVADSDASVLILGETGTGKELVARAIHRLSRRRGRNFIKVNCAAIPTGLLESELFGHEKGAFTGAISQKIGRMELADGGTLFLDEVGEIPLELQPKLLRVLQDQEFERLGSTRTVKVNLRLVAATNRDLARSVADRQFRNDLFYRINVFPIHVPPLRERRTDIPELTRYFVSKFTARMEREIETIPTETMKALTEWSWPGNIRELENLMERSVILSDGPTLHVPLRELHAESPPFSATDHTLDNAEREHIIRVLRETGGLLAGPGGAAHRLGLKRTTLQSKMQRLKITRQDYSRPEQK